MRELILAMSMSLDGFVSGPAGETEWIFSGDQEAIAWKLENAWSASLHIMGSRTFQGMAGFWPTSTNAFAPPMNQIPKAVFSKQGNAILPNKASGSASTELQPGAESWADAYVASGNLADEISMLKAGEGKPIIAHGGATFARSLIAEDLVDQYMLTVYPLALGQGLPIFSDLAQPRRLELISSRVFPKGSIAQIYRRA
jgi:dihydrofolate reductase